MPFWVSFVLWEALFHSLKNCILTWNEQHSLAIQLVLYQKILLLSTISKLALGVHTACHKFENSEFCDPRKSCLGVLGMMANKDPKSSVLLADEDVRLTGTSGPSRAQLQNWLLPTPPLPSEPSRFLLLVLCARLRDFVRMWITASPKQSGVSCALAVIFKCNCDLVRKVENAKHW